VEEDTSELRIEWERHPYTIKWAKYFAKKKEECFKQLMACCMQSADPNVRTAHEQYAAVHANAALFAVGGDKK
jgi:hypothetical protein